MAALCLGIALAGPNPTMGLLASFPGNGFLNVFIFVLSIGDKGFIPSPAAKSSQPQGLLDHLRPGAAASGLGFMGGAVKAMGIIRSVHLGVGCVLGQSRECQNRYGGSTDDCFNFPFHVSIFLINSVFNGQ